MGVRVQPPYHISGTLFFFGNDFPTVEPADCTENLVDVPMRTKFVKKADLERSDTFRLARADIKNKILVPCVQDAFISAILTSYTEQYPEVPDSLREFREDNVDEDEDEFKSHVTSTGASGDYIIAREMAPLLKGLEMELISLSVKRMRIILTQFCSYKDKKIDGKAVEAWVGVKRNNEQQK
jgi:hypothetical protein